MNFILIFSNTNVIPLYISFRYNSKIYSLLSFPNYLHSFHTDLLSRNLFICAHLAPYFSYSFKISRSSSSVQGDRFNFGFNWFTNLSLTYFDDLPGNSKNRTKINTVGYCNPLFSKLSKRSQQNFILRCRPFLFSSLYLIIQFPILLGTLWNIPTFQMFDNWTPISIIFLILCN